MNLHRAPKKTVSIKGIIIITFMLIIIIFSGITGYIVFANWINSARQTTEIIAAEDNKAIYNHIDSFLYEAESSNRVNYKIIDNGILDVANNDARDRFFAGVLESYGNNIYSFSFGTITGEYYGACRNEDGQIDIIRANADTRGSLWYNSKDDNLNAGDNISMKFDKFDPRTRPWYKAAVETGIPTFSPIYRDFITGNLIITHSWPVYNDKGELMGVLETSILLSKIDAYLNDIVQKYKGYALIVEKETGKLVANSWGIANYKRTANGDIKKRYTYKDINSIAINKIFEQYKKAENKHFLLEGETENLYIYAEDYQKEGIDWVIISAVPENWIIAEAYQNIQITVIIIIIVALLSAAVYFIAMKKLLKPMDNLLQVADNIASGNFSDRAIIVRND